MSITGEIVLRAKIHRIFEESKYNHSIYEHFHSSVGVQYYKGVVCTTCGKVVGMTSTVPHNDTDLPLGWAFNLWWPKCPVCKPKKEPA